MMSENRTTILVGDLNFLMLTICYIMASHLLLQYLDEQAIRENQDRDKDALQRLFNKAL